MIRVAALLGVLSAGAAFAAVPAELRRWPGWDVLSATARERVATNYRIWKELPESRRAELARRHEALKKLSPERRREVFRAYRAFSKLGPERREQALGRSHIEAASGPVSPGKEKQRFERPARQERPSRPERPQRPERPKGGRGRP